MTSPSRPRGESASYSSEPPHRRDNLVATKKDVLLLFGVICFVACTSCIHYSFYLPRSLAIVSTTGAGRPSSSTGGNNGDGSIRRKERRSRQIADWSIATNKTNQPARRHLDFVIAGFPKTGTTSLLYAFGDHPETAIASSERCAVTSPMVPEDVAVKKLQEALSELPASPHVKRAIKCPSSVYHAYSSIVRMEHNAPDAKFVIGLRHPVLMLESYYNYRVTELYDRRNNTNEPMEEIPPLDRLIGLDKEWKGVSTESTDFKTYLLQFGKTKIATHDLQHMSHNWNTLVEKRRNNMAIKPNRLAIFLYTVDQLEDAGDVERSNAFRSGLQHFLGLETSLKPVGHENLNRFVGKSAHRETVNICLPKYNSMRRVLLMQGSRSAEWIETEFIHSPDVTVANRDHFLSSIRSWSVDPCSDRGKKKMSKKDNSSAALLRKVKSGTHGKEKEEKKVRNLSAAAKKQEKKKRRFYLGRKQKFEILPVKL